MAQAATKLPVKTEAMGSALQAWRPFVSLRHEIDRLFEDFDRGVWQSPFRRSMFDIEPVLRPEWISGEAVPAMDIAESPKAYEVTAELPGIDEKNIEVKLVNGSLMIKGEKQEEKKVEEKEYYLHERHFGSFERCFRVPEGVDTDKIEANFEKGVLKVTLPKKPEAQEHEKKIEIKAA